MENTAIEIDSQDQKLGFELEKGLCLEKVSENIKYPVEYFAIYTKDLEKAQGYLGEHCNYPKEISLQKGAIVKKKLL